MKKEDRNDKTRDLSFVQDLAGTGRPLPALVGGKVANLAALSGIEGIQVPGGFCITTEAYKEVIKGITALGPLLDRLAILQADDLEAISKTSAKIRAMIATAAFPQGFVEEISNKLQEYGTGAVWAIRSSATAEDLPGASFAGQQDTYLNITGTEAVLLHISKCWASLFTDRAVSYRIRNGFDHRKVQLAVMVQQMIVPEAAGVLFTADPLTGHRKVVSIDAVFGLGERLVSGKVTADHYTVREGRITDKRIPAKTLAVYALENGGTEEREIPPAARHLPVLTGEQITALEQAGRKIEAYFGCPQDIEWCLANGRFYIVQSRPVTTLFPVPEAEDGDNHVYVSVGHQQMMTDAMKPLGISFRQLTTARPMAVAGGRMFVDIAADLASPARRFILVDVLGKSDPLFKDIITTILERGDFIPMEPGEEKAAKNATGTPPLDYRTLKDYDTAVVASLISQSRLAIETLQQDIRTRSGTELMAYIREDLGRLRQRLTDPQSFGVIMTGMNAATWINDNMKEWLGESNAADTLTQSVSGNITSEMGLALLDVADTIRPYPEVIAFLQQAKEDNFPGQLEALKGGKEAMQAIAAYLDTYGMRCAGEIDITKRRWSEKPFTLIPLILGNIKNFEPGAGKRKFDQGLQEALQKEQELLERLKELPGGIQKAAETQRMIRLLRSLAGYREYPKYDIVCCYFIYKQALLKEAGKLFQEGILQDPEDIYYLSFEELEEWIRLRQPDYKVINERKEAYSFYKQLRPPRVITSDGEIFNGSYKRDHLPAEAIVGLPVSSGVVEGRARVILDMEDAHLEEGDILVTAFTDPSWTPLFVSVKGLVTEVGGLMTHGAVIAREYGLPAIVGVEDATRLIKDGQRIRIDGTEGYIEIL